MQRGRSSSCFPQVVYWVLFALWIWFVISITGNRVVCLLVLVVSILSYPLSFERLYAPLWKRFDRLLKRDSSNVERQRLILDALTNLALSQGGYGGNL